MLESCCQQCPSRARITTPCCRIITPQNYTAKWPTIFWSCPEKDELIPDYGLFLITAASPSDKKYLLFFIRKEQWLLEPWWIISFISLETYYTALIKRDFQKNSKTLLMEKRTFWLSIARKIECICLLPLMFYKPGKVFSPYLISQCFDLVYSAVFHFQQQSGAATGQSSLTTLPFLLCTYI